jgi:hypothetical protein
MVLKNWEFSSARGHETALYVRIVTISIAAVYWPAKVQPRMANVGSLVNLAQIFRRDATVWFRKSTYRQG